MPLQLVRVIVIFTVIVLVGFFSIDTLSTLSAIQQEGSGYRTAETDFSQKDVICTDLKNNSNLSKTLYGKTGCITAGELAIKKMAVDAVVVKGLFVDGVILLSGFLALFGINKIRIEKSV